MIKQPEIITRKMLYDTHKLANGICQNCGFITSPNGYLTGKLSPGGPVLHVESCTEIQKIRLLTKYDPLPKVDPSQVPEFKEARRPRKARLKFSDGRYIKVINAKTYNFVRTPKEATIFDSIEEVQVWKSTISRIWDRGILDETI